MPKSSFSPNHLSIHEAAQVLGVADKTLRRWEESGVLIPLRSKGGHRRYKKSEVEAFKKYRELRKQSGVKTAYLSSIRKVAIDQSKNGAFRRDIIQTKTSAQPNIFASFSSSTTPRKTQVTQLSEMPPIPQLYTSLHPDQKVALRWTKRTFLAVVALFAVVKVVGGVGSLVKSSVQRPTANTTQHQTTADNRVLGESTSLDNVVMKVNVPNEFYGPVTFFNALNVQKGLMVRPGGTSALVDFQNASGAPVGSITFKGLTTSYNTTSDQRLKTNVTATTKGLSTLKEIKVHDFNWKGIEESDKSTGVLAQELQKVYPQAVTVPENPEANWSVDYSKLVPLLIQSVQDQQVQIEALQKQVNEMSKFSSTEGK